MLSGPACCQTPLVLDHCFCSDNSISELPYLDLFVAEAAQHTTITQLSVAHLHETNLSCSSCAACHEHVAASHPRGQMRPGAQGRDPRTLSSMTSLSWVSATRFLAYFVS